MKENLTRQTLWKRATSGIAPGWNDLHVWRVHLPSVAHQQESFLQTLSDSELTKSRHFRFEKDRNRYVLSHGVLRQLLGTYLDVPPQRIAFEETVQQKPILSVANEKETLCFNLSHAGDYALYAVARGREVGVDIECIHHEVDIALVASRFFSPREIKAFEQATGEEQRTLFFQYWTRKEAFLKAWGKGMTFPMEQCDVSAMSGSRVSPVTVAGAEKDGAGWYGVDLLPATGYAAAVVAKGEDWNLSCWHYGGQMDSLAGKS